MDLSSTCLIYRSDKHKYLKKQVRCTRKDLKCEFIMKQTKDVPVLHSYSTSRDPVYLAILIKIRNFRVKICLVM